MAALIDLFLFINNVDKTKREDVKDLLRNCKGELTYPFALSYFDAEFGCRIDCKTSDVYSDVFKISVAHLVDALQDIQLTLKGYWILASKKDRHVVLERFDLYDDGCIESMDMASWSRSFTSRELAAARYHILSTFHGVRAPSVYTRMMCPACSSHKCMTVLDVDWDSVEETNVIKLMCPVCGNIEYFKTKYKED